MASGPEGEPHESRGIALRAICLGAALAWAIWIYSLAMRSSIGPPPDFGRLFINNGGHAFAFFVLSALAFGGVPRNALWRSLVALLCAGFGGFIELQQANIVGRVASFADALTNVAGIALTWTLFRLAVQPGSPSRRWGLLAAVAACLLGALLASL